jgi:hypothetical protein
MIKGGLLTRSGGVDSADAEAFSFSAHDNFRPISPLFAPSDAS